MTQQTIQSEVKRLGIAERILLVEEIWDSIVAEQEHLEVTKAQRDELDCRIDAYHALPDKGSSWDEVNSRLKGSK